MKKAKEDLFVQEVTLNSDDSIIWQDVDLSAEGANDWIQNQSGLDEGVVNILCAEETRPRTVKTNNGILIVLRGVNMNPGHDPEDMVSIRVWLEDRKIISVRRRPAVSLQDIFDDISEGSGPVSTGDFFTTLVDKLANRIGDFVSGIDEQLSETEDALEVIESNDFKMAIGSLRRQIATVRRYLAPQRDALDRINFLETSVLTEKAKQRMRDESDRVSRYLEDLDLARERAVVLHEAYLIQIAQQQNNRIYGLSIVTAIFLPLGFVTGLLGINVGGMPGADNANAFWVVTSVLFFVVFAMLIWFKKFKWI